MNWKHDRERILAIFTVEDILTNNDALEDVVRSLMFHDRKYQEELARR